MEGGTFLTKEQVKVKFNISSDCTFKQSGDKCCHALNPVKKYGCNEFCGKDAATWMKTNHPECTEDAIKYALERFCAI